LMRDREREKERERKRERERERERESMYITDSSNLTLMKKICSYTFACCNKKFFFVILEILVVSNYSYAITRKNPYNTLRDKFQKYDIPNFIEHVAKIIFHFPVFLL